jgi:hypothetical protein
MDNKLIAKWNPICQQFLLPNAGNHVHLGAKSQSFTISERRQVQWSTQDEKRDMVIKLEDTMLCITKTALNAKARRDVLT